MSNEINEAKNALETMRAIQAAWNVAYPKFEGDIPTISFKVGYKMNTERIIKSPQYAQIDWAKWLPYKSGSTPNDNFIAGYEAAS